MTIRIGKKGISDQQQHLLERCRRDSTPHNLLDAFMTLINDREIRDGEEALHPSWFDVWEKRRARISQFGPDELVEQLTTFFNQARERDPEVTELDPQNQRICFLLGAGASKPEPSGIPTVKELLPDLLARARRLDREEVTRLAEFCESTGIDNIEDLLTAAQISEFCGRNPTIMRLIEFLLFREDHSDVGFRRSRRASVDVSSVAFLQDTLQVLFGLLSSRMLPAEPNEGHIAIANYARDRGDTRIVTTNYDCCMDLALSSLSVPYRYPLDFANSQHVPPSSDNPINLVKLHGSLNWFYCETCQEVHWIDIQKTVEDYNDDRALYPVIGVCRTCGGQRRGLLVPPLAMKFDVAPALNPLIEESASSFGDVDLIVVVGFSFADADLYISRMVSKAMQANPNTKMLIFDPMIGVVQKVREKFSVRIPDFDSSSRILSVCGDCSKTLPRFLSGAYRQSEMTGSNGDAAAEYASVETGA
ncbi:SIR2 family NAD-dependent protein deacylase [Bythopirellula goksoeyrii]|uniref:NAD-dependent deacetylase n=1 Tax=Bythopirellula goksoeyrii TaxID=1400387 RepID=A0A5B9QCL6_9BACT|nr:SIR2 family protein [Bythopirellula goksoeyrii]QEG36807.1 NAD-dependent deacetylase [Bythopirellula goksoeyrii]